MGGTRRAHQKSRAGCIECKRRRIKCGEEKPRCHQCKKYDKSCEYAGSTLGPSTPSTRSSVQLHPDTEPLSQRTSTTPVPSISSVPSSSAHIPSSLFDAQDLSLFHHWCLTTSISIVNTRNLDHLWQTTLPKIGFRHIYVMHSLLSLSALHIAYLDPFEKHSNILNAAQHHSKALDGFRQDIDYISPENCDGLFVNAILIFLYTFITFGKLYDPAIDSKVGPRILGADWIPLMRGVGIVLQVGYEHITAGPLNSLLSIGNWMELCPDPESDPDDKHIVRIREVWNQGDNAAVYDETLELLRKCRAWIIQFEKMHVEDTSEWGHSRSWTGPFLWLFLAPQRYLELLAQRQPSALLIFAHFGATLHAIRQYWWIDGCSKSIVDVVSESLGPYWDHWMEWPKQVVER
ncbi:hypothetical protein DM02DRAFT_586885 [Periconia macrospinosa]|uniref:Zn(2)-C6 fungal-type domain-containing protein n=1 Tax=Periconia macrospinosa TaxID=97972 RepID=A0A2V1E1N9_9PLEO|nr:hypothetical protein DM02DRAFT_586885 [Periconia macrospinosa]